MTVTFRVNTRIRYPKSNTWAQTLWTLSILLSDLEDYPNSNPCHCCVSLQAFHYTFATDLLRWLYFKKIGFKYFFFKNHLFIWKTELGSQKGIGERREREREYVSDASLLNWLQIPGFGQAKARNQQLHLHLPRGCQGPKHLDHHSLLYQVQQQGAGWEVELVLKLEVR